MAEAAPVTPARPLVVTFPDEIDMTNARQVRQRLYTALAAGAPIVIADMTATRFCDSMGLRALVMAHKRAAAADAELRVAVSSEDMLRIMAITKLDTAPRSTAGRWAGPSPATRRSPNCGTAPTRNQGTRSA